MSGSSSQDEDGLKVALDETRQRLNQQMADQKSIDDKAGRTVRLIILAAGVVATAYTFGSNSPSPTWATGLSLFAFTLGVGAGVVAYTHTKLWTGARIGNLDSQIDKGVTASAVRLELLEKYPEQIKNNADGIKTDAFLLRVSQALLIIGVILVVADLLA